MLLENSRCWSILAVVQGAMWFAQLKNYFSVWRRNRQRRFQVHSALLMSLRLEVTVQINPRTGYVVAGTTIVLSYGDVYIVRQG